MQYQWVIRSGRPAGLQPGGQTADGVNGQPRFRRRDKPRQEHSEPPIPSAGDPQAGIPDLRLSIDLARDTPYEAAAARLVLAEALAVTGDSDSAVVEARTARQAFERLGATPDVARANRLLADVEAGDAVALDTPADPPKPCGRSPGRPLGRRSDPAPRYPAIKKAA